MPSDREIELAKEAVTREIVSQRRDEVAEWDAGAIAKAALEAAEQERQEGWRPISEAPKDGARFLAIRKPYEPCVCWYNGNFFTNHNAESYIKEDDMYLDSCEGLPYEPSHWMPLPPPPIEE